MHAFSRWIVNELLMFVSFPESERAKDGDGFDQVGNNPCNSTFVMHQSNILQMECDLTLLGNKMSNMSNDDTLIYQLPSVK